MVAYRWPGTIRELVNRVQRMVLLADSGRLTADTWQQSALNEPKSGPTPGDVELGFSQAKKQVLAEFERRFVTRCLRRTHGNLAAAARLAGIDRKNFWNLARKHDIDAATFRPTDPELVDGGGVSR
jgi:two-component system NtrC family response regulator